MPFETKFICDTCQPNFIFYKVTEEDPRKVKMRTPSCPQCKERKAQEKLTLKVNEGAKPSEDMTIVEQDNKLKKQIEESSNSRKHYFSCQKCYTKILVLGKDRNVEKVCPKCEGTDFKDVTPQTSAIKTSSSNFNKAVDQTAEMVMQDYKMTDINMGSSLRAGDTCVPKLQPHQEQMVDKVFDGKTKNNVLGMQGDKLTSALMKGIESGAYKNYGDPVARQQADPNLKPKFSIIDHYNEKPQVAK
jgi:hypothetical protein